jgi:integrase
MRQILKRYKLWANLQGEVKFEREFSNIGKALTPDEEAKLLAASESNALLHTVVSLALNTALRKNEIRLLRWSQIDLFNRTLTVGRTKTEGGSGRVVPLNAIAGRFPGTQPGNYIFPSCENARIDTDHPYAVNIVPQQPSKSWRTTWRRVLKDTGLQIRFHDLRHCCITKLAESHASEQTIMAIAGHLSRSMIEHYSHIRMAAKKAALEGIVKQVQPVDFQVSVNQNVHQRTTVNSDAPSS